MNGPNTSVPDPHLHDKVRDLEKEIQRLQEKLGTFKKQDNAYRQEMENRLLKIYEDTKILVDDLEAAKEKYRSDLQRLEQTRAVRWTRAAAGLASRLRFRKR